MGIRISKDHLHPSVIESITSLIGDLSQLETTAKGNAVEAINELLANVGSKEELEALIAETAEGKELIANAVGEPVSAEDTFSAMSSDINGLLSTFKTNMMNNGVTVESSDKFKQLIDKIATMVEEGEGKGIQYASGDVIVNVSEGSITVNNEADNMPDGMYLAKISDLGFKPYICVCVCDLDGNGQYIITSVYTEDSDMFFTNQTGSVQYGVYKPTESLYVSNDEITMPFISDFFGSDTYTKYYAIGVGEEDTTLRDSLASILTEEGVEVTEEDDMASLITKVDAEFDNKNISDYLMAASSQVSFRVDGTSWTEVSFDHSFGKVPKLVLIGINSFGSLVSSMYHTNESNYTTYTYNSSSKIYMYISSIDSSTITLNMKYSNASGSMSTAATFYYTMIY